MLGFEFGVEEDGGGRDPACLLYQVLELSTP